MVHFVGAGSGAADLITMRGARLLREADVVIYAGSLVNPELLAGTKPGCEIHNSAEMTLEQVLETIAAAEAAGKTTVRLHTGDSSIYGAVREQFDRLEAMGVDYDVCPGVSAFCGAAASLRAEYTLPGVSQSVIITRTAGRTAVPERESIRALAAHRSTMVLFLSAGLTETGTSYRTSSVIFHMRMLPSRLSRASFTVTRILCSAVTSPSVRESVIHSGASI